MKALLLAAGAGTRLRPLTDERPKAMVEIGGEPAVAHVLRWVRGQGVAEVAINLHHCPGVLTGFVGDGAGFGVRVTYSLEPVSLGTAGALRPLRPFFERETVFLVVYGDVLTDLEVGPMLEAHRANRADVTIALHEPDDPTSSGVMQLDASGRVTRFVEKPAASEVFSRWANGGILLCGPAVFAYIDSAGVVDFGRDVLPSMLRDERRVFGHASDATFIDFGTPERLRRAEEWAGALG